MDKVFPRDVWVVILKMLDPKDRIPMMQSCRWMCETALEYAWSPWENRGKGLIHACGAGYFDYFVRWSQEAGDRWKFETHANYMLLNAIYKNREDVALFLLGDPRTDPSGRHNEAICLASEIGSARVTRRLLEDPRVDPAARNNQAITFAARSGAEDTVALLLADPRVDPTARRNFAIRYASQYGHAEVVKLLLEDGRANPVTDNNEAICCAEHNGHLDVVRLLMEDGRANPAARDNQVLRNAVSRGDVLMVRLLSTDARIIPYPDHLFCPETVPDDARKEILEILNRALKNSKKRRIV